MDAVTVLIVDDQACFRSAARGIVAAAPGFSAVGEAASGEEALEVARTLEPDLVLVDVGMPGLDGVETSRRLSTVLPAAVIVLVSADDHPSPGDGPGGAVTFLRKDVLTPAALRALWDEHGVGRVAR